MKRVLLLFLLALPFWVSAQITNSSFSNGGGTGTDGTFTLTTLLGSSGSLLSGSPNVAPSFVKGPDQNIVEDFPPQTVVNWATSISKGSAEEDAQILTYSTTNDNNSLFSVQPSINPITGTLTFTTSPNAFGLATVTVVLSDDGGTLDGGIDTSPPQTFTITVRSSNDTPFFVKGADQTILEDAGAQTLVSWATAISKGPANEEDQVLTFLVTNTNHSLFSVQPSLDPLTGTLTYTPEANAFGTATVNAQLKDNGGTANGGVDTYFRQFSITILPVPDITVVTADSLALVAFYNSTNGAGWTNKNNWLTGPVNTWFGVTVAANRVSQLILRGNNLTGALSDFTNLRALTQLDLANNLIAGAIPITLNNVTSLQLLNLYNNRFTGTIPSLPSLMSLTFLSLGANPTFTTQGFPAFVFGLTNLQHLALDNCRLQGTLPGGFSALTQLKNLNLSVNTLSGSDIPPIAELGTLQNLETLFLNNNFFSGTLPPSIAAIPSLTILNINGCNFNGLPAPSAWVSTNLAVDISNNLFDFGDMEPLDGIPYPAFTNTGQKQFSLFTQSVSNPLKLFVGDPMNIAPALGGTQNSYQWLLNGNPIGGATNSSLVIVNPQLTDGGLYQLSVTNSLVTSITLTSTPLTFQFENRIETLFALDNQSTIHQDISTSSFGGYWADIDQDGDEDLFVGNSFTTTPNFLYENMSNGSFQKITSGDIVTIPEGARYMSWGDYDNDGYPDVFAAEYTTSGADDNVSSLYRNNGDKTFSRTPFNHQGDGGLWVDYNNDGLLDLSVSITAINSIVNKLYKNKGDGTFELMDNWVPVTNTYYVGWVDVDNDGDMDYNITSGTNLIKIFRNNGNGTFAEQNLSIPSGTFIHRGSAWGDIDGDGDMDLFAMNTNGGTAGVAESQFYINDGTGNFSMTAASTRTGVRGSGSRGCTFSDADNDGDLDLFLIHRPVSTSADVIVQLFSNDGSGNFTAITSQSFGYADQFSGLSLADFNNDGAQDLFVGSFESGRPNYLFRNLQSSNGNNWLKLKLVGVQSNKTAIGARVDIYAGGKRMNRQIIPSTGLSSQNSYIVHSGLASAIAADSIVIRWPSGLKQRFDNIPGNQQLTIIEGQVLPPFVPATNIVFSNVTNNAMSIAFIPGDGEKRVVLMKEILQAAATPHASGGGAAKAEQAAAAPAADAEPAHGGAAGGGEEQPPGGGGAGGGEEPGGGGGEAPAEGTSGPVSIVDGTELTGNADFTIATEYQPGWKVMYAGSAATVNVTGLRGDYDYQVTVIEYNGSGTETRYLNEGAPFALQHTRPDVSVPTIASSTIEFFNVRPDSMKVNFTSGNGEQRLAIMKAGSAPTFIPTDDAFYSGDLGNGELAVYNGNESSFDLSQLLPDTEYFITLFEFNTDSTSTKYLSAGAPVASQRTLLSDSDGDGIADDVDNCWDAANSNQADEDGDGKGDVCDVCPSDPTNRPTTIRMQPQYTGDPRIGGFFDLTVDAAGTNLSYQWKKEGINVGTNSPRYSVANVTLADVGAYRVVVTGDCGTVTSDWVLFVIKGGLDPVCVGKSVDTYVKATSVCINTYTSNMHACKKDLGCELEAESGLISCLNDALAVYVSHVRVCLPPSVPASSVNFANVFSDRMTISFTKGDGENHLVLMKVDDGAVIDLRDIRDGLFWSANSNFALAMDIGIGHYRAVMAGSDASVTITGLRPKTSYEIVIVAYNGADKTTKYQCTSQDPKNPKPECNYPIVKRSTLDLPLVYVTAPANGAINQNASLNLTAKAVTGASLYTIETSTDPDFNNGVQTHTGGRTLLFDALQYNTLYYTRVKTDLRPDYGQVTTFATRPAESIAYITSPADNAVNTNTTLNLTSNNVPYANLYTIQLSETADFAKVAFEVSGPTRTLAFTGLKYNTTYYNRVLTDLTETFGAVRSFTTRTAESLAYVTSPANSAVNVNTGLNISSSNVTGASSYTIQLSEAPDFSSIAFEVTGPTRTLAFAGLKYNTTYYNRVLTDLTTEYGQVRSFTTRTAESIAYVTSPGNSAVNVNNTSVNISSNTVPGATTYMIQLSESPDFTTIDFEVSGNTRTLAFVGLKYNTIYFNRVLTDLTTEFGQVRSFTTRTAESLTYVSSPANNAVDVNYNPNITANNVPDATLYTIQLSESSDFASVDFESSGITRTLAFAGLSYNTVYYNRVKTDLSPNWGTVRSFTTSNPSLYSYMTSPANNATNVKWVTNITSNTVTGANVYTIEANTEEDFSGASIVKVGARTQAFTLEYDRTYYVRVKTDLFDEWGATRSFTTGNPVSLAYVTSPVNGGSGAPTTLNVSANSLTGATSYTIELNTSSDFTGVSMLKTKSTRTINFDGLAQATTYYTRVMTSLAPGEWGPTLNFSTINPAARDRGNWMGEEEAEEEIVMTPIDVQVLGNPFRERLSFIINTIDQQAATVSLYELNGRAIHEAHEKTNALIEIQKPMVAGVYLLKINAGTESKVVRVVKMD